MQESMTLAQLKNEPHYSYSALNCYLNICQLQYYYRYVEKLEPEQTPVALPFGTAFHAALSEQAQAAKSGRLLPVADLTESFAVHFRASVADSPEVVYRDDQGDDELIALASRMLETVTGEWPDYFQTIDGVAVPFRMEIAGLSKPLIGEYDMVLKAGTPFDGPDDAPLPTIVDWKTSSRMWPADRADRELQASVYIAAYESCHGQRPDFRYDVATKAKAPRVERFYTGRTDDQLDRMRSLAVAADRAIARGVFMPNETSFACAGCPYASACGKWHCSAAFTTTVIKPVNATAALAA